MADDALWYEAALLVGVTNALNVVADSPLDSLEPASPSAEAQAVFGEIRAFYDCADVPLTFRRVAADPCYLAEMRRLGVGERGVMEVLGVTQMFSSYTKIADTLQLEPDMDGLAAVDRSPAPGGAAPPAPTR